MVCGLVLVLVCFDMLINKESAVHFALADQCSLMERSMLDLVFRRSELATCLLSGPESLCCFLVILFCCRPRDKL